MGSTLFRTIQILLAIIIVAMSTIGILWILGLIDLQSAKMSAYQIGGVLGVCLLAALFMVAVFSIGRKSGE